MNYSSIRTPWLKRHWQRQLTKVTSATTACLIAASACGLIDQEEAREASFDEPANLAATAVQTLAPASISVKRGATSAQPVSVLAVKDQSGTDDNWNSYIEFTPASTGAAAVFTYPLPAGMNPAQIKTLQLAVNYKGPALTQQKWTFSLYDTLAAKWVAVGSNAAAPSWQWATLTFNAAGTLSRFVSTTRKISVRYETATRVDASDLDYLVLLAGTDGGATPTPSPTPSPSATPTPSPTPTPVPGAWWRPAPGLKWQMQYSGTMDTTIAVNVFMLDMFMTQPETIASLKSRGVKVVCYIDGGSWESYTPDASQFPASVLGKIVDGWPDERFLDIRSQDIVWPLMRKRLDLARSKGCDAIYHDWADSYSQDTGFPLTANDQLTYNRFWVAESHARGLSVGLINDLLQVAQLASDYDFAINESCMNYNECGYLKPFIDAGKPVYALQYSGDPAVVCPKLNALNFDGLYKKVALDAWRQPCR